MGCLYIIIYIHTHTRVHRVSQVRSTASADTPNCLYCSNAVYMYIGLFLGMVLLNYLNGYCLSCLFMASVITFLASL